MPALYALLIFLAIAAVVAICRHLDRKDGT